MSLDYSFKEFVERGAAELLISAVEVELKLEELKLQGNEARKVG